MHLMARIMATLGTLALVLGSASLGRAQSGGQATPAWISVSPTVWISTVNQPDTAALHVEDILVPMGGGSVTLRPPALPSLSFVFKGLYGEGDGDAVFLSVTPTGLTQQDADAEVDRADLEATVRFQIPEMPVYVFASFRYVDYDARYKSAAGRARVNSERWIIGGGAGAAPAISQDGRHRLFANFTVGASHRDVNTRISLVPVVGPTVVTYSDDSGWDPAFDLNAGYSYAVRAWLALDLRYRSTWLFEQDEFGQDATAVVHGPEFGFSLSW